MIATQDIMPKLQEKISQKHEELRIINVKLNFEDITHSHLHKSLKLHLNVGLKQTYNRT